MSQTLVKSLLLITQGDLEKYKVSAGFEKFFGDFGISFRQGNFYILNAKDRLRIKNYLQDELRIDWKTPIDAWKGISRDKALTLGGNEKMTSAKVRDCRVAIKSLPGRPLLLAGKEICLPDRSSLDIEWQRVVETSGHKDVLVIENWTNFEKTSTTPLLKNIPGNPLVLYRGDPIYGADHAKHLLTAMGKPVTAFVDYDPAGLLIAGSFPCFEQMLCPDIGELHRLLSACTKTEEFIRQKSEFLNGLENLAHQQLKSLWKIFNRYGVALPQEELISDVGGSRW
ncbi:hypothetical protein IFT69_15110 [Pseudomonas putida]|nr:hypothetical protein [Pseudomonas putida]